jgi:hypothetical protein
MVRKSMLERIFQELLQIRYRLDDLEAALSNWNPSPVEISESKLLILPDNLRKTYMIVASKGESSAAEVSNLSGRCRCIESNYLNQLVRMGWLSKRRVSKTIHFRPVSERLPQRGPEQTY